MSKQRRDHLADALDKLAGADAVPTEPDLPAPPLPELPESPSSGPSNPQPPGPTASNRQTRPSSPSQRPNMPPSPRPSVIPSTSAPAPPAAPRRPLAQDAAPPLQGAILINPVDENSAAYAPAAPGTSGGAKKKPARGTSTAAVYQTIEFRRTAIPILLTCGLLTIAFGALKYISGPDSPVADLPGWLPIALFITGAVLMGLAIANMLSVKQHLDTIKK